MQIGEQPGVHFHSMISKKAENPSLAIVVALLQLLENMYLQLPR